MMVTKVCQKFHVGLEMLIRNHGGVVLSDIPLPCLNLRRNRRGRCKLQQLPIVLSPKKLQTPKFLYGRAVNAFLLKTRWLADSIKAGSVVRPDKCMILSYQSNARCKRIGQPIIRNSITYIFDKVGIMLHGKHSFCTKLEKIIKHGGGWVFKTLQWLVQSLKTGKNSIGAIVAEDEGRELCHLRHCALKEKLPMVPVSWIIKSLHLGRLIPLTENEHSFASSTVKIPEYCLQWSSVKKYDISTFLEPFGGIKGESISGIAVVWRVVDISCLSFQQVAGLIKQKLIKL